MTQVLPTPATVKPSPVRLCDYGGVHHPPATVSIPGVGAWCSVECRMFDRGSEVTVWRQASGVITAVAL